MDVTYSVSSNVVLIKVRVLSKSWIQCHHTDKKYAQTAREFTVKADVIVIAIGSHRTTIGIQNCNSKNLSSWCKSQNGRISEQIRMHKMQQNYDFWCSITGKLCFQFIWFQCRIYRAYRLKAASPFYGLFLTLWILLTSPCIHNHYERPLTLT